MQLILASASIGREFLLKGLKIPYQIIPSQIDEDKIVGKNLVDTIKLRAKLKGEYVAKQINQQSTINNQQFLILSADTEVMINNKLLGKPKDHRDAVRMLKMLSGKTHEVVSAFYILKFTAGDAKEGSQPEMYRSVGIPERQDPQIKVYQGFDRSRVTFRRLTEEDIRLYLSITEYTRYTGSYALVASPQNFITKIEGSISNVIGLPLEKVIPILKANNLI